MLLLTLLAPLNISLIASSECWKRGPFTARDASMPCHLSLAYAHCYGLHTWKPRLNSVGHFVCMSPQSDLRPAAWACLYDFKFQIWCCLMGLLVCFFWMCLADNMYDGADCGGLWSAKSNMPHLSKMCLSKSLLKEMCLLAWLPATRF